MREATEGVREGAPETPIVVHPALNGADDILAGVQRTPTEPDPVVEEDVDGVTPEEGAATRPDSADRAAGLDALRGVYLLAMNFAFTLPMGVFANWMYHIQYPPPDGSFAPIPGLSWQDIVYAGFVFAMAAALPIGIERRLAERKPYPAILWMAVKRAALLYLFALIIGHVSPYYTGIETRTGNLLAMAGFVVCLLLFTRWPRRWSPTLVRGLRILGWAGAAALLFLAPALYGEAFSLARRDDIIASIAAVALLGTAICLFTRGNLVARLAVLAVAAALKLAAREPGWVQDFWTATGPAGIYEPWYLELLVIVVAGTIAGDLLVRWMRDPSPIGAQIGWSRFRLALITAIAIAFVPIVLIGTYIRAIPETTLLVLGLAFGGALLSRSPGTPRERVLASLFGWGAFWLALGILLEPFEGGIKKDPQTLSYLFVTSGLATVLLAAAIIVADVFGARRRALRPLIELGQNPMLAYVVFMLFLNHLFWYLGFGDFLENGAAQATVRAVLITGLVALLVWAASRARLYWRA